VGDPTRVLFFNQGQGYRYAHPLGGGDDCTIVVLDDAVAWDLVEEAELPLDPARGPFHAGVGSAGVRAARLERELSIALETPASTLELQALVLELVEEALRALSDRQETPALTRRQRELVEEARLALLHSLAGPPSLVELAARLGCSPFHLSRLFRATGLGLRQYLRRVRVRLAAERLRRGPTDLTELALELGFCDHSHLTRAFRAEWGVVPSRFAGTRAQGRRHRRAR
jgi:AraC-like DNA-binding protein